MSKNQKFNNSIHILGKVNLQDFGIITLVHIPINYWANTKPYET